MALRTGNVHATTVEELLAHTAARRDQTVQWKHRNRPVCAAFRAHGAKLLVEEPAPSKQLGPILAYAALRAGIYVHVRPHAIRRGAAKDTRTLASQGKSASGAVMPAVQEVLMHSHESLHRGVTKAYTGTAQVDDWAPRVSANMEHNFDTPHVLEDQEERY